MKDNPSPWEQRWKVSITCRDCGACYECLGVDTSVQMVAGFNRMFLAGGPEVCPECKNLKLLPSQQLDPAQQQQGKGDDEG